MAKIKIDTRINLSTINGTYPRVLIKNKNLILRGILASAASAAEVKEHQAPRSTFAPSRETSVDD